MLALVLAHLGSVVADEVSPEQQAEAKTIAHSLSWQSSRSASTQAAHPLAVQTLSIEKQEIKNAGLHERVNVYQYNYDQQQARVVNIDLLTGDVLSQKNIASVHLPLSNEEIVAAIKILSDDQALIATLQAEQQQRRQTTFTSVNELNVKASIFEPLVQEHSCAVMRCALLSLFDSSNTVFATEPLVNLSAGTMTVLQASR